MRLSRVGAVVGLSVATLLLPSGARAQTQRIGSCYAAVPKVGVSPAVPRRHIVVLIDRTVTFDETVKGDLIDRVSAFVSPGDRIIIAQFSSYGQGDFAQVAFDGRMDVPLTSSQRYWISKFELQKFDHCIAAQTAYMAQLIPRNIRTILANANASYTHTDIIGTLNQLAPEITADRGAAHYLVVVSDMLENSDVVSFYHKNNLRLLNPAAELEKVRRAGFLSNLGDTRVYAEGPAFSLRQGDVRDQNFRALKDFWDAYFAACGAKLIDFGTPLLHGPIQ